MKSRRDLYRPPDLVSLTGEELLRRLVEVNLSILAVWCPSCRQGQVGDETSETDFRCPRCGQRRMRLDASFWQRASDRITRALQRDQDLLARVKAEWESMRKGLARYQSECYPSLPPLAWLPRVKPLTLMAPPTPLAWLAALWERKGKPRGRPVDIGRHYELAAAVQGLRDRGLRSKEIVAHLCQQRGKQSEKDFQTMAAQVRTVLRWLRHQQAYAPARLRGERVKETRLLPAEQADVPRKLPADTPRPTGQDQFRFNMVSIWVRQEGLTKAHAIDRMVTLERGASQAEEIRQSLDRVERYTTLLAKRHGIPLASSETYWHPGVIRDRLRKLFNGNESAGPSPAD